MDQRTNDQLREALSNAKRQRDRYAQQVNEAANAMARVRRTLIGPRRAARAMQNRDDESLHDALRNLTTSNGARIEAVEAAERAIQNRDDEGLRDAWRNSNVHGHAGSGHSGFLDGKPKGAEVRRC